jgi:uncharacterized protein with PQ loop repeat
MQNGIVESIGYVGSFIISFTLLPQIIHTYRIRNADGLSLLFLVSNACGTVCMLIYAVFNNLLPILMSNVIILFLILLLIWMTIRFRTFGSNV